MGAVHTCRGLRFSLKVCCPDFWEIIGPTRQEHTHQVRIQRVAVLADNAEGLSGKAEYQNALVVAAGFIDGDIFFHILSLGFFTSWDGTNPSLLAPVVPLEIRESHCLNP